MIDVLVLITSVTKIDQGSVFFLFIKGHGSIPRVLSETFLTKLTKNEDLFVGLSF